MYYHRNNLLIGFHGCDAKTRDAFLTNPNKIKKSECFSKNMEIFTNKD